MSPPRTGSTSEETSQAQMDALGERMDRQFNEVKDMLLRYEERLRGLENREAGCAPIVMTRIDAAWRKLDMHDGDIDKLNDALDKLARTANYLETISKWLLGIITAVIISLIIAFLTGRIDVAIR